MGSLDQRMKMASHGKKTTPRMRGTSRDRAVRRLAWAFVVVQAFAIPGLWSTSNDAIEKLRAGDHASIVRHALAPGFGDPDNFQLGDFTTQRNLSDAGRGQARAIEDWLRSRGIDRARVYSTQWCRCWRRRVCWTSGR